MSESPAEGRPALPVYWTREADEPREHGVTRLHSWNTPQPFYRKDDVDRVLQAKDATIQKIADDLTAENEEAQATIQRLTEALDDDREDAAQWMREEQKERQRAEAAEQRLAAVEQEHEADRLELQRERISAIDQSYLFRDRALQAEAQLLQRDAAHRVTQETAFKAGYHCRWHRDQGAYCFDPAMSPGDPEGAFQAWLAALGSPPEVTP